MRLWIWVTCQIMRLSICFAWLIMRLSFLRLHYLADMHPPLLQDEYEQIDAVYTEEKKQLHELEERFKTLEEEYIAIMEERRIAREKREAAERELAIMVRAATTIQAFWRSFKVRKALKSKKKKKGGKKKK